MVFRPIDLYVITSMFFYVFYVFFQNPKNVTFYVFCRVSYVFSNYEANQACYKMILSRSISDTKISHQYFYRHFYVVTSHISNLMVFKSSVCEGTRLRDFTFTYCLCKIPGLGYYFVKHDRGSNEYTRL